MTCQEMLRLLPALAERDGTPRVALEGARHLSGCAACAAELLRLRELHGLLDRFPQAEVPRSFTRRVLRVIRGKGGAGAAALAIILLGVWANGTEPGAAASRLAPVLSTPVQAASTLLRAAGRAALDALTLDAFARPSLDGPPLWLMGSADVIASRPVLTLALAAALSGAAAWAVLGLALARFRRESRTGTRPSR